MKAEQIAQCRKAWADAGHGWEPRVSVSRSVLALFDDETRSYFGAVQSVDTLTITVPNQCGAEFNTLLLASVARDVVPALR